MSSTTPLSTKTRITEVLAGVADTPPEMVCVNHPGILADAVCAECGRLFCWQCVSLDQESLDFQCYGCQARLQEKTKTFALVSVLKEPFFYVALAVVLAGVAYVLGVGNPDTAALARADRNDPWYHQRAGKLWLRQATRTRRRVAFLEHKNRTEAMCAWASLSAGAFRQAADSWAGSEPEADLRIGEALMLAKSGKQEKAYQQLLALDAKIPPENLSWPSYMLHRGELAFELGKAGQGKADWTALLTKIAAMVSQKRGFDRMLDGLIDIYGKDRQAFLMHGTVRGICDTAVPTEEIREKVVAEFEKRGFRLPAGVAEIVKGGKVDRDKAGKPRKKPREKLVIKRN